jgi:hypothetical protein
MGGRRRVGPVLQRLQRLRPMPDREERPQQGLPRRHHPQQLRAPRRRDGRRPSVRRRVDGDRRAALHRLRVRRHLSRVRWGCWAQHRVRDRLDGQRPAHAPRRRHRRPRLRLLRAAGKHPGHRPHLHDDEPDRQDVGALPPRRRRRPHHVLERRDVLDVRDPRDPVRREHERHRRPVGEPAEGRRVGRRDPEVLGRDAGSRPRPVLPRRPDGRLHERQRRHDQDPLRRVRSQRHRRAAAAAAAAGELVDVPERRLRRRQVLLGARDGDRRARKRDAGPLERRRADRRRGPCPSTPSRRRST